MRGAKHLELQGVSPLELFHAFPQSHQTLSILPTPSSPSTSASLTRIPAASFEWQFSNS